MKKISYLLFILISVCFGGCNPSETDPYGYIATTVNGSSTFVLKGYENASEGYNVFKTGNIDYPFYIQQKKFVGKAWTFVLASETGLDKMTQVPSADQWIRELDIVNGMCFWARCQGLTQYDFLKIRVAYVMGNNVGLEYVSAGSEEHDLNKNDNANVIVDGKTSLTALQTPHYSGEDYYVDYYVNEADKQILNFALQWNAEKKHAAWVAFSFDELTCQDLVKRTNEWEQVDLNLPINVQVNESMHRNDGFGKGHLCASEDRVYSEAANKQTFYYSNISPQLNELNTGFWQSLENKVRSWGRSVPNTYDELFVTKGASLNDLLINFIGTPVYDPPQTPKTDGNGFTVNGLACPKYYFMAVLSKKGEIYQAIGFWVEHKEGLPKNPSVEELKACALSIDDLEKKTGIDLFCNLPDVIENAVESSWKETDWTW